jgi:murein DD-endopeptidase MepM/ murein hydrolase activator NlpD
VEAVRDLGSADPWQESLERSLARRGKRPDPCERDPRPRKTHVAHEPARRTAEDRRRRDSSPSPGSRRPTATAPRSRRRSAAKQTRLLAASSWGILLLGVLLVAGAGAFDGHGAQASVRSAQTGAGHRSADSLRPATGGLTSRLRRLAARPTGTCRPVTGSSGYVNPLAGDVLTGERIDQGVDYAGTGTLTAIGAAKLTYVGTSDTGWPGAFVEYRLLGGPDAGCFIYYAEGINPAAGLRAGQRVRAGQLIANIIPGWSTGIELGWGGGTSTRTYAAKTGKWSATDDADSIASEAGKSFSALITSLGGPAGKVEGVAPPGATGG